MAATPSRGSSNRAGASRRRIKRRSLRGLRVHEQSSSAVYGCGRGLRTGEAVFARSTGARAVFARGLRVRGRGLRAGEGAQVSWFMRARIRSRIGPFQSRIGAVSAVSETYQRIRDTPRKPIRQLAYRIRIGGVSHPYPYPIRVRYGYGALGGVSE